MRAIAPLCLCVALCAALLPALASAEPYPQEVKDAFLKECVGGGAPAKTCACTLQKLEDSVPLADVASESVPKDTLNQYVADCLQSTGDMAAVVADSLKPSAAPTNSFGPDCKAYFASVNAFCEDAAIPSAAKAACPQWLDSIKQMESVLSLPGVTQDVINSMEMGCKGGADAVQQARAAFAAPATP